MERRVIHIFGASGSGTSTLGRYIADQLGYDYLDTDDVFWLPTDPRFTTKRARKERLQLMEERIQSTDKLVIAGSLTGWGDSLIPYFTLLVRVVTATEVRMARLEIRERERFGSRIEAGGDMYETHRDFMQWAEAYDDGALNMRSKAKHDAWEELLQCELLVVNGEAELAANLERVKACLASS